MQQLALSFSSLRSLSGHKALGDAPPCSSRPFIARQGPARMWGRYRKGAMMLDDQDFRDDRADVTTASPSAHLLDELQLHGYRPLEEEGDPSPLPSPEAAELALATIFEAATGLFAETRLEPDLPDLSGASSISSPPNRAHGPPARRQRDRPEKFPGPTGWLGGSLGRAGAPDRSWSLAVERRNAFEFSGTARPISSLLRRARRGAPVRDRSSIIAP